MPPDPRPTGEGRSAAVILAAGRASRMGAPKTLLAFRGEPLIRRAARSALDAGYHSVSVVIARYTDAIGKALDGLPVAIIVNPHAHEGIGTSIAAGVRALGHDVERAALILSDQPFVTSDYLAELSARAVASPCDVVASRYAGTVGAPALFARGVFPRLVQLSADQGCKAVIAELAERTAFLDCPAAAFDVDTPEDYARLTRRA